VQVRAASEPVPCGRGGSQPRTEGPGVRACAGSRGLPPEALPADRRCPTAQPATRPGQGRQRHLEQHPRVTRYRSRRHDSAAHGCGQRQCAVVAVGRSRVVAIVGRPRLQVQNRQEPLQLALHRRGRAVVGRPRRHYQRLCGALPRQLGLRLLHGVGSRPCQQELGVWYPLLLLFLRTHFTPHVGPTHSLHASTARAQGEASRRATRCR
jgi:hypothetical protein